MISPSYQDIILWPADVADPRCAEIMIAVSLLYLRSQAPSGAKSRSGLGAEEIITVSEWREGQGSCDLSVECLRETRRLEDSDHVGRGSIRGSKDQPDEGSHEDRHVRSIWIFSCKGIILCQSLHSRDDVGGSLDGLTLATGAVIVGGLLLVSYLLYMFDTWATSRWPQLE